MMTLGDLKDYFATSTVNQALRGNNSILGKIVHWATIDIIKTADFWWNKGSDTFSTVESQSEYFLSNRVSGQQIWKMVDETNDHQIFKKDLDFFYDLDPTPTDEGEPSYWAYVGQEECQAVPAAAGTISLVSSSSNDNSITVIIKGKSSGIQRYESLSLTATTAVTGTISWDASTPISISLGSAAQGIVTATRGSVTVAQIPPGHLRIQQPVIRLWSVPGDAYTIRYFFYKRAIPLVSDSEVVDLPDEAFEALRYGVEEICHGLNTKLTAANEAYKKRKQAMAELVSWSQRDIAGNEIKDYRAISPFSFRLPDIIDGEVT